VQWPADGGAAYAGWFGVFSLASAAVILGAQAPGPFRTALSLSPLVLLGRMSYGVYVYHWPVFVLVDRRALHTDGWVLFAVRMLITLAVAAASYWLVELPVRQLDLVPRRAFVMAMPAVATVVALVAVLVPATAARRPVAAGGPSSNDSSATSTPFDSVDSPTSTVASSVAAPSTTVATTPVDVLLLGDSTAMMLAAGLDSWVAEQPQRQARSLAESGCGVMLSTRMQGDDSGDFVRKCSLVLSKDLPEALATRVPDVVVVMVTLPDVSRREWVGDEGMLPPSDLRYHLHALADHRALTQELVDAGVQHIVWVLPPVPADWWIGWLADEYQPSDWDAQAAIIDEVASEFPEVTDVVDLDAWLTDSGLALDVAVRDDGLHLTPEGSARVMAEFLGPVLLRLVSV
jgi:lysophospholipase L1-like esterase